MLKILSSQKFGSSVQSMRKSTVTTLIGFATR